MPEWVQHDYARGIGDTVNDAFAHWKFTSLFGEICIPRSMTLFPVIFTGGVPVYKHPGTDKECPAQSVRYEIKKADRK